MAEGEGVCEISLRPKVWANAGDEGQLLKSGWAHESPHNSTPRVQ